MSKKRFSAGLNDLFSDTHHPGPELWGPVTSSDAEAATRTAAERKVVGKNFMADLDALLQEALDEGLDAAAALPSPGGAGGGPATGLPTTGKSKSRAATSRPAFSGLDALIRQTIDVQEIDADEASGKKRLTVAVDKTKLEKLKTIAKLENSYLKDLLTALIDEYIREYRQRKGIDL